MKLWSRFICSTRKFVCIGHKSSK